MTLQRLSSSVRPKESCRQPLPPLQVVTPLGPGPGLCFGESSVHATAWWPRPLSLSTSVPGGRGGSPSGNVCVNHVFDCSVTTCWQLNRQLSQSQTCLELCFAHFSSSTVSVSPCFPSHSSQRECHASFSSQIRMSRLIMSMKSSLASTILSELLILRTSPCRAELAI